MVIESQQLAQIYSVFGEVLDAMVRIAESIVSNSFNENTIVALPAIILGLYMRNTGIFGSAE